jgi:ligand-binding SRPBCC domain-containing protein
MHIVIKTPVKQNYKQVAEGFTEKLFLSLNPPFPPVKLLRFDGCKKGDRVSLQLNFIFFKQRWDSVITYDVLNEQEFGFIDEGEQLPFFLKTWKHHHRIKHVEHGTVIEDDIHYTAPFKLLTLLLYPVLYLQFLYRRPVYQRIFKK